MTIHYPTHYKNMTLIKGCAGWSFVYTLKPAMVQQCTQFNGFIQGMELNQRYFTFLVRICTACHRNKLSTQSIRRFLLISHQQTRYAKEVGTIRKQPPNVVNLNNKMRTCQEMVKDGVKVCL